MCVLLFFVSLCLFVFLCLCFVVLGVFVIVVFCFVVFGGICYENVSLKGTLSYGKAPLSKRENPLLPLSF